MDWFTNFQKRYLNHQVEALLTWIKGDENLLDFGCGEMSLDRELLRRCPKLKITGVDVVDPQVRIKGINFRVYDGKTLPFPDKSFDTVLAYHVFHHCNDPEAAFSECVRVSRRQVLFVEPILRSFLEKPGFMLIDWLTNAWRGEAIAMPYNVRDFRWWHRLFRKYHLTVRSEGEAGILPSWLPIGKTMLFSCKKT